MTVETNPGPVGNDPLIDAWVEQRRRCLGPDRPAEGSPAWGLALSGGGIRSATFALGLASGLAQQGLLRRFDLLSTVSGGGYIGSALGRLFRKGEDPLAVEKRLAQADGTWFVWWLRATSRYLTPRGASDLLNAAAAYARNMIAVHVELALAGIVLGALLAYFNLFVWGGLFHAFAGREALQDTLGPLLQPWLSTVWLLIALPVLASIPIAAAYWSIAARRGKRLVLTEIVFALLLAVVGALLAWITWQGVSFWRVLDDAALRIFCGTLAAICLLAAWGPLVARLARPRHERPSRDARPSAVPAPPATHEAPPGREGAAAAPMQPPMSDRPLREKAMNMARRVLGTTVDSGSSAIQRNRLTHWMAVCLMAAVALFVVGAIERAAWFVAFERRHYAWLLPLFIALGVAVARALATQLPARDPSVPVSGRLLARVVELAGLLLFALLAVFWVAVVYRVGLRNLFESTPNGGLLFEEVKLVLLPILLLPALYILLTSKKADFSNLSSLHMFYRARLTRSYLGAANGGRFATGPQARVSPLEDAAPDAMAVPSERRDVFHVHPDDSVAMADYAPHEAGGPVHILNATINQTRNELGGLFNQDRKGQYLCVTSGGHYRVGLEAWTDDDALAKSQLPAWMAISGAAVAPGVGGQTSTGLSLLLFLSGVRLGFWWEMGEPPGAGWRQQLREWLSPHKYRLMYGEALARFGGREGRFWYLSDGGHFENTGAYTLLRQRAKVIVLSDAAADPRYEFGDLENLVRKARIDLRAEITFVDPASGDAPELQGFGTLDQLSDPASNACLALARIDYHDGGPPGWLVYVKPNVFSGLPLDVLKYRHENLAFPQEPTADQFFSESQWESYFRLGRAIGAQLTPGLLQALAEDAAWTGRLEAAPRGQTPRGDTAVAPDGLKRLPFSVRFPRVVPLAKSGLGLTAVAGVLAAAGQAWTSWSDAREEREQAYWSELYGASALHDRVQAGDASLLPDLKARLATLAQRYCTGPIHQVPNGDKAAAIIDYVAAQCKAEQDAGGDSHVATPACAALVDTNARNCLGGNDRLGQPAYWGVSYSDPAWARGRVAHGWESRNKGTPGALAHGMTELWSQFTASWVPSWLVDEVVPTKVAMPTQSWQTQVAGMSTTTAAAPPAHDRMPASTGAPASAPADLTTTSVPAASPAQAAASTPAASLDCRGKLVYLQIYRPQDRAEAMQLARALSATGARAPGVEDVTATAQRAQRQAPAPVRVPTVIYHTEGERDCAMQVLKLLPADSETRKLGLGLRPTPGVLEVWLPPAA
ncbi:hypothetical protein PE066_07020 [Ramlibacter tataouinensis]|uniref:hypothetical protein n=1 Tax=Ramlibacter tataouinensis TaxID=94132 RepID=UPI0022F38831|nr:hypothetical protein [Ramlibacter tataouinensis]WBY03279.1 hypothetical protein PE066_07020 [Ramlibacter tataouinensis]